MFASTSINIGIILTCTVERQSILKFFQISGSFISAHVNATKDDDHHALAHPHSTRKKAKTEAQWNQHRKQNKERVIFFQYDCWRNKFSKYSSCKIAIDKPTKSKNVQIRFFTLTQYCNTMYEKNHFSQTLPYFCFLGAGRTFKLHLYGYIFIPVFLWPSILKWSHKWKATAHSGMKPNIRIIYRKHINPI